MDFLLGGSRPANQVSSHVQDMELVCDRHRDSSVTDGHALIELT